jgi:hypothetical protein
MCPPRLTRRHRALSTILNYLNKAKDYLREVENNTFEQHFQFLAVTTLSKTKQ